MTTTIQMDASSLVADLKAVVKNLPRELSIVSGKAAKRGKSIIAKEIASELAVPQKVIKKHLSEGKVGKTNAFVSLEKSARLPLRDFKARQTKRGLSYKISKSKGRQTIHGPFQGPRPGKKHPKWNGRVFQRIGKARLPIQQLFGPSPWGVLKAANRIESVAEKIDAELEKQLVERIRFKRLKKSGAI